MSKKKSKSTGALQDILVGFKMNKYIKFKGKGRDAKRSYMREYMASGAMEKHMLRTDLDRQLDRMGVR